MKFDQAISRKYDELEKVKQAITKLNQATAKAREPRLAGDHDRNPVNVDGNQKKLDTLTEKSLVLTQEISELKTRPDRVEDLDAAKIALKEKQQHLVDKIDKMRERILSFDIGRKVWEGADPLVAANKYQSLLDEAEKLRSANDAIVAAFRHSAGL